MTQSEFKSIYCLWGILFVAGVFVLGCEKPLTKRQYKETFAESPKSKALPDEDMFSRMPKDDIHAGLMPQDDPHTGIMPQDDIHAGLMPQDDIHAGLKSSGMMDMSNMQDPQLLEQVKASMDKTPLSWETPPGWVEKSGNGLRLATFTGTDPNAMFETTIVSLGGPAGGIAPNVERWMQQFNLPVPDSTGMDSFIKQQERFTTSSKLPVTLVDLTKLQGDAPADAPSMIAAIIERDAAQVFVKMTGSKAAVLENLAGLKSLINSIKVNQ